MASTPKALPISDAEDSAKKRTRSPAYPFVDLETAIRRAKEFFDHEKRNAASRKVAVTHWGYEEKSSGGLQTIAALISFGLMKDEGTGAKRKLQLTQDAVRLLLDERPDSVEKAELIKQLALTPKIHRELWSRWGSALPSEQQVRYTLTAEWEPPFNENTVDVFIKEYKDTIAFAKLMESDKLSSEVQDSDGERGSYTPKVGDYVQWESGGVLQFPEPKKLRELSSDGTYAFVEGSYTGLPVAQLRRAVAPTPNVAQQRPTATPIQPLSKTHMQEFVVPLSDGRAVFQWPNALSKEDVDDLRDSLKILERKITRSLSEEPSREKSE
jgi:hypothetical protein